MILASFFDGYRVLRDIRKSDNDIGKLFFFIFEKPRMQICINTLMYPPCVTHVDTVYQRS